VGGISFEQLVVGHRGNLAHAAVFPILHERSADHAGAVPGANTAVRAVEGEKRRHRNVAEEAVELDTIRATVTPHQDNDRAVVQRSEASNIPLVKAVAGRIAGRSAGLLLLGRRRAGDGQERH
jgi:hypothetical protein